MAKIDWRKSKEPAGGLQRPYLVLNNPDKRVVIMGSKISKSKRKRLNREVHKIAKAKSKKKEVYWKE
jgi:hypothetical protein